MHRDPNATDEVVIDPLIARFEGLLVRYAARITGDLERARDVVQETFLALHREVSAGSATVTNGHMPAWLFTVCRRRALDIRRKEKRMTILTTDQTDTAITDEATSPIEQAEAKDGLLKLLARLPERQQEVVRLKFQNGLSYREIAEVTDLSVGNVGYLLHVAITRLREMMME